METNGGFYVSQIKQLQDRIFERLLQQHHIRLHGSQGRILFVLWKQDHLSLQVLAQETSLAKNTLSSVIDRMIEKNLVTRKIDTTNRRKVMISLTVEAKSYEQKYEEVSQEMNQLFYQGMEVEEIERNEQDMQRIVENLKRNEGILHER